MTEVQVRLPGVLREHAGGARVLPVQVTEALVTVRALLDAIAADAPALERRIRDESGALRRHVNVFVGEANVRDLAGLDTRIDPGVEVHVIPAVSGG